jgi:2-dehydropantoate 2-reductase
MTDASSMKIAILGTGANGSCVGADLTKAGLDVTLIDQWPAHVEAMKADGLDVTLPDEHLNIPVQAWHLCELAEHMPEFDVVFVACKAYDTRWLVQLIEPYLKEDGICVGLQNSMTHTFIAEIVGEKRTLGAVVELSSALFTPGIVTRNTKRSGTWFGFGDIDGTTSSRAELVRSIMANVAKADLVENIASAKWTKLVCNCMNRPIGLTGMRNAEAKELPGMNEIAMRLGQEAQAVGEAMGLEMQPIFGLSEDDFKKEGIAGKSDESLAKFRNTLLGHIGPVARTAAIHDFLKGRRTETGNISGLVVQKGKELGIPVPHNAAIIEIDRRIMAGELELDVSNFGLLKSMLTSLPNRGKG